MTPVSSFSRFLSLRSSVLPALILATALTACSRSQSPATGAAAPDASAQTQTNADDDLIPKGLGPSANPAVAPLTLKNYPLVIMYHDVVAHLDASRQSTSDVDTATFRAQIKFLKDRGYNSISGEDILDALDGKRALPARPVLITFDDGYLGQFTQAAPALREAGMKAIFFVNPFSIEATFPTLPHMTWDNVKTLEDDPLFEIQSHTEHHLQLDHLTPDELKAEFAEACTTLTQKIGHCGRLVAYPFGRHNRDVIRMAAQFHDCAFAVGTPSPMILSRFEIPRLSITTVLSLSSFKSQIDAFRADPIHNPLR